MLTTFVFPWHIVASAHKKKVYRKALKLTVNKGAVHQFSLLAHTVPVSVELDQDEVAMEVR